MAYPFLFAMSRFLANLLKFSFSVFPDTSGRVDKFSPVPDDGEKLGGTLKKKSSPYFVRNTSESKIGPFWGGGLGPNSPKYDLILMKLASNLEVATKRLLHQQVKIPK